jgi:uncharacterized protein
MGLRFRRTPAVTRRASLLFLGVLIGGIAPALAAPDYPTLTVKLIDRYLIPRFKELAQATDAMAGDFAAGCGSEPARLKAARQDFERVTLDWAGVEFLRFGPMAVIGRPERFSFLPDARGIGERQLRALIAKRDESALDPVRLAQKSAAVQGLTVLEALLTDGAHALEGSDEEARYRCRLAVAVARNLANLSRNMLAEWDGPHGWRQRMLVPGPDNPSYRTPAEPPAEFARALVTGLQMLQDREVTPLMTADGAPGKAPRLPFARTGLSARYAVAAIASLSALYEAMGLADTVPKAKVWMPQWITMAFRRLFDDAPAALKETGAGKPTEDRQRQVRMLRFHVDGIRKLVGRELAPAAGLTIGFNELDGD